MCFDIGGLDVAPRSEAEDDAGLLAEDLAIVLPRLKVFLNDLVHCTGVMLNLLAGAGTHYRGQACDLKTGLPVAATAGGLLFCRPSAAAAESILREGTAAQNEQISELPSSYRTPSKPSLSGRLAEPDMCARCEELDKKITHYRELAARVRDPLLTEGVEKLVEEMEAQKVALHPEQQK